MEVNRIYCITGLLYVMSWYISKTLLNEKPIHSIPGVSLRYLLNFPYFFFIHEDSINIDKIASTLNPLLKHLTMLLILV